MFFQSRSDWSKKIRIGPPMSTQLLRRRKINRRIKRRERREREREKERRENLEVKDYIQQHLIKPLFFTPLIHNRTGSVVQTQLYTARCPGGVLVRLILHHHTYSEMLCKQIQDQGPVSTKHLRKGHRNPITTWFKNKKLPAQSRF